MERHTHINAYTHMHNSDDISPSQQAAREYNKNCRVTVKSHQFRIHVPLESMNNAHNPK